MIVNVVICEGNWYWINWKLWLCSFFLSPTRNEEVSIVRCMDTVKICFSAISQILKYTSSYDEGMHVISIMVGVMYAPGKVLGNSVRMTQTLESFINKVISVITGDGRNIVGLMKGFDQTINLVLEDSHERVFSEDAGVEQIPLGLYIVRGDNVAVIGELDEDLDKRLDFSKMKASPLGPVWVHM
ncbi:unnamed protein product [Litomosoides sigmodontis]|uniref:U6 snRNA-associated Sm-like protein LSm8 n=1 Tax=Litomosoides sigmodontis TaxID=42156 RepID=A0A3P6SIW3_LITSI|nr:unnamed protein product [Litomosoides sigmodontis]